MVSEFAGQVLSWNFRLSKHFSRSQPQRFPRSEKETFPPKWFRNSRGKFSLGIFVFQNISHAASHSVSPEAKKKPFRLNGFGIRGASSLLEFSSFKTFLTQPATAFPQKQKKNLSAE